MSNSYMLRDLIVNGLQHDSNWGIYAEECSPAAEARIGQTQFEQGGLIDGKRLIVDGVQLGDALLRYTDGDENADDFIEDWVDDFIRYEICNEE